MQFVVGEATGEKEGEKEREEPEERRELRFRRETAYGRNGGSGGRGGSAGVCEEWRRELLFQMLPIRLEALLSTAPLQGRSIQG